MRKLKDIDYTILFQLVRNSKTSDRKLAKIIGVSQPTVTRRRSILEREGLIDYTAIPDFRKLGYEIIVFTFADLKHDGDHEKCEEFRKFLCKESSIVFVSTGRGLERDMMCVSIHKDYAGYASLRDELSRDWGSQVAKFDSFIISIESDDTLKQLSLGHLENGFGKTIGIQNLNTEIQT